MTIQRPAGRFTLACVTVLLIALSSCTEPANRSLPTEPLFSHGGGKVPCQATEIPNMSEPTCELDGITVYAPRGNRPKRSDPPPVPPIKAFPQSYTPGGDGGSHGGTWRTTQNPEGHAPEAEDGPFADGPVLFTACTLVFFGIEMVDNIDDLRDKSATVHAALGQLNEREAAYQFVMVNSNKFGEEELLTYRAARDAAQASYIDARNAAYNELKKTVLVSLADYVKSVAFCSPAAFWIPWF